MTQADVEYSRPESDWRVRGLMGLNQIYARGYHHLTVKRGCRLPRHGPAILVCNHTSSLDPSLVQAASPRPIRWMMAREYAQVPLVGWVSQTVGTILVNRDGRDMAATRTAMRALENGYVLGVFPEGKIADGRGLLPFHPGVAMLAAKSGVPVFPAYLDGSQRKQGMLSACLTPHTCTIAFGEKVDFSGLSRSDLRGMIMRIRDAVAALATC